MKNVKTIKNWKMPLLLALLLLGLVPLSNAQEAPGVADQIKGLQPVLQTIYDTMIKMSSKLIHVSSGLAGFGALWFIASRVWKSLAAAEPIDFYPLLRPFALGLCISLFPQVLAVMNSVLQPTITGTEEMLKESNNAVKSLLAKRVAATKITSTPSYTFGTRQSDEERKYWKYQLGIPENGKSPDEIAEEQGPIGIDLQLESDKLDNWFSNSIRRWVSEILQILFEAAALCINTIRTFQLVVLAILGPVVFGFAVYDGFQHTLTAWIAKYINIFLWLPVCNIFGTIISTIQEEMLKIDAAQLAHTGTSSFGLSDTPYLIFMIIGIVGYMTVPTVAGYIVNAGGAGAMVQKMTSLVASSATGGVSRMGQGLGNIADMKNNMNDGYNNTNGTSAGAGVAGAVGRAAGAAYQATQLSGSGGEDKK